MIRTENTSKPYVSVIIPVYNDCERLKLCLEALARQSYPKNSFEVIVIDNGLNPGIAEASARCGFRLIVNDQNNIDASRNKGVAASRGDVLAFTDSDCIPAPDWLEKGIEMVLQTANCGAVGGRVVFHSSRGSAKPGIVELYAHLFYIRQYENIKKYSEVATANMFAPRSVFKHAGDFDPSLCWQGDFEWCRRVKYYGYSIAYCEAAVISHPAPASLVYIIKRSIRLLKYECYLSGQSMPWIKTYFAEMTMRKRMKLFMDEIALIFSDKRQGSFLKKLILALLHSMVKGANFLCLIRFVK